MGGLDFPVRIRILVWGFYAAVFILLFFLLCHLPTLLHADCVQHLECLKELAIIQIVTLFEWFNNQDLQIRNNL